jgi:hypothetical protein
MSLRGAKRRGNPVGKYMISLDRRASLRSARDDRTEFPDVPLSYCVRFQILFFLSQIWD